ncbi:MAG: hypothetical protein J6X03_01515 [Bacilli bacterium]|nr:hypothetical protein [Bacilli bacterium]
MFRKEKSKHKNKSENLLSKEEECRIDRRNYKLTSYFTQNDSGQASSMVLQVYEEIPEN